MCALRFACKAFGHIYNKNWLLGLKRNISLGVLFVKMVSSDA